jgi:hypothetical protein
MPAYPSDKGRMGVKTLGWWIVKAWDRDGRILFHDSLLSVDIIWKLTNFVALQKGVILMNLLREGCQHPAYKLISLNISLFVGIYLHKLWPPNTGYKLINLIM